MISLNSLDMKNIDILSEDEMYQTYGGFIIIGSVILGIGAIGVAVAGAAVVGLAVTGGAVVAVGGTAAIGLGAGFIAGVVSL